MKSRRLLFLAGLLLVASPPAIYALIRQGRPAPPAQPRRIEAATIVACVGYVEPAAEVRRLAFKGDGIIARSVAELGHAYHKGDVLMAIDNRDQVAAVAVASAELRVREAERDKTLSGTHPALVAAAEADVRLQSEQLRYFQLSHARLEPLLAKDSVARSEYDRTFTEVEQCAHRLSRAKAGLASLRGVVRPEDAHLAEARVAEARGRLALANRSLDNATLRAPFDGVILEVYRREGEAVRPADPEPVALFADVSRLRVRIEVDDRHAVAVSPGQRAIVSGFNLGGRSYAGRIASIKGVMGKKEVFIRSASERKDLDVVQAFVETDEPIAAPVGLEVEAEVIIDPRPPSPQTGGLIR